MTWKPHLVGLFAACFASACVPVQPSERQLVGTWQVVWACGTEVVSLKPDATYVQQIEYTGGGSATHTGNWRVMPKQAPLEGAHVILQAAMRFCSETGEKLEPPEQGDRALEAIWEWGRLILSFSPDVQGFERR